MFYRLLVNPFYFPRHNPAFEAVTGAFKKNRLGPIEDPIDSGIRKDLIRENLAPLTDVAVARQDHGRAMFSAIHEIEYFLRDFSVHRDDTPVINNPKMSGEKSLKELIEIISHSAQHDLLSEPLRTRAIDAAAVLDGEYSDGECEMGFSDSRRSKKKCDLILIDELEGCQVSDFFFVNVRIK